MIWVLLALHLVGIAAVFVAAERWGPRGLLVGGVAPALTAVWSATQLGVDEPSTAEVTGAVAEGDTVALDLLVVVAIVGFTATAATSRFIERHGDPR